MSQDNVDQLRQANLAIPFVEVSGEDHVNTSPQTISLNLAGEQLETVNKIRRALVTNRDTLLNGDYGFGTNQHTIYWLLELAKKAIAFEVANPSSSENHDDN